jgi:glucan-binding YG repeat protein/N-acetylmuramoyl-L-alanine amidase
MASIISVAKRGAGIALAAALALAAFGAVGAYSADAAEDSPYLYAKSISAQDASDDARVERVDDAVAAVAIESAQLDSGAKQQVGIVLNDEDAVLASLSLAVSSAAAGGPAFDSNDAELSGSAALVSFSDLPEGTYYVSAVRFTLEGGGTVFEQIFELDEANLFTVSAQASAGAGDVRVAAFDLDATGSLTNESELAATVEAAASEAIEAYEADPVASQAAAAVAAVNALGSQGGVVLRSASSASGLATTATTKTSVVKTAVRAASGDPSKYRFVVALDPGHGGSDPGAVNGLYNEDALNWKIAQACATYLRKYENTDVYITRGQNEYVGLQERVTRAKANGAQVFISLHLNSSTNSSANGVEVYYPINSSYLYGETHLMGQKTAQEILNRLAALGFTNRGIKTRTTTNNSRYADGSLADYYGVIYHSRTRGIPGLIVEHAFISNGWDVNFVNNNISRIGKADAEGIAAAYGLDYGYWWDDNGTWKYWNGSRYLASCWLGRANTWYYFDANSKPATGLRKIGGVWYYFNKTSFAMERGWVLDGSKWYYGRSDGAMRASWSMQPGWLGLDAWYYFDPSANGHPAKSGFFTADGKRYFADSDCRMKTGWIKSGSTWHYAESSGALVKGWRYLDAWYFFDPANANYPAKTGLFAVDGKQYYADSNCRLVTNRQITVNGKKYQADKNGELTEIGVGVKNGWVKDAKGWHYYKNNVAQSGWIALDAWYYLDPSDATHPAKTGFFTADGKRYFADANCRMQTGWILSGGKWYYAEPSGALASGWKGLDAWYYFDPADVNRAAKTGFFSVGGKRYYADANCRMRAGWIKSGSTWHYAESSGALASGWKYLDAWYYLDPSHANHPAKTGFFTVGGTRYYADANCRLVVSRSFTVGGLSYVADSSGAIGGDYPIMGASGTTAAKMAAAYRSSGRAYPSGTYSSKGAPTIDKFCQILYEEANAEGVRAEVVFSQIMLETGWLQFGGDVKAWQCNFGGLGATGGGNPGLTFLNVRTGIQAQVQHLKAYASTAPLNKTCVDPRFGYVSRGSAPTVVLLGIPDNPQGLGWAATQGYGQRIINIINGYGLV